MDKRTREAQGFRWRRRTLRPTFHGGIDETRTLLNETDQTRAAHLLRFLERKDRALAVTIALLAFLVGWWSLDVWWLNPDEGIFYSSLGRTDSEDFWNATKGQAHPPLYWLILRFLGSPTTDFVWYRAFSLACGCFAIFANFLAAREVAGSGARGSAGGLIAALLIAASPGVTLMSQLIRPYTLQLASLSLAVFYLVRYLRTRKAWGLVGYALFLSAALLTHYSSLLAFGVIAVVLLGHLAARRFALREILQLAAAHAVPLLTVSALYVFHLRALGSRTMAADSLQGWLAPYMIRSAGDVWSRLLAFHTFLLGPHLAVPGVFALAAGVALAARRRFGTLAGLTVVALALAVLGAATGRYPFGCSRHSVWLIAFVVPPIAWMLGVAVTSRRWLLANAVVLLATLVLVGEHLGRVLDTSRATIEPQLIEQCLKRSDVERMRPVFKRVDEPGIVLLTAQSYHTLVPLFRDEGEHRVRSSDRSFFRFRWGERDVVVLRTWWLSIRARDVGKKGHLHTLVRRIDREEPQLRLGEQSRVLMILAAWSPRTLEELLQLNTNQPPGRRLISNGRAVPGLYTFDIDIAAYTRDVDAALARRKR